MANQIITAQFQGLELSVIDHNNQRWLTSEQIGLALGYQPEHARTGINRLFSRHKDEFTEQDTCEVNLTSQGQPRKLRIFSATGCHLLSFFSNTPRAKQFRAWAKQVLAGSAPAAAQPAPVEDNLTLCDRIEMLEMATVNMAYHMKDLVAVSRQQAEKLEVTSRYIGLLEINQKGKIKVTRQMEAKVLALRAQGMSLADIGRVLRISTTAVSQLANNKYPFAAAEAAAPKVSLSVEEVLNDMVEKERRKLLKSLNNAEGSV